MCVHLFILQTAEDQQSLWQEVRSHTLNFKQHKQKLRNKSIKTIDLASCCRWIDFSKLMRHCVVFWYTCFFVAMGHRPRHPQEIGRTWFGKLQNTMDYFFFENEWKRPRKCQFRANFGEIWIMNCPLLCSSISYCVLYVFSLLICFVIFSITLTSYFALYRCFLCHSTN